MPTPETPAAAEPVVEPSLSAIPEGAGITKDAGDYGVDKFFPAEPAKVAPVVEEKKTVVNADDAPPPPAKGLAAKLAEKSKPAAPVVEAKKLDAPAPQDNPEDKLELGPKAAPETHEQFKTLKGVTRTLRTSLQAQEQKAAELQAKLDAASKAPTAEQTAELTRLREESKALSDRLLLIDTQNHPKFKAQFVEPKNQALASAKELLGDKAAGVDKLMGLPRSELGKAVQELTKDMPDMDRLDVAAHVKRAWELEQGGKEALSKAGETYGAIRSKTVEEQKQLFGSRFEKIVPSLAENIVKLEMPANATVDQRQAIERYNSAAESIRANAEKVALGAVDEDAIVQHAAKSAAYDFHVGHVMPRLGQEISEMQDVIAGLTKELAMYRGKNPNRDIGASVTHSEHITKAQTIEEIADAKFGS